MLNIGKSIKARTYFCPPSFAAKGIDYDCEELASAMAFRICSLNIAYSGAAELPVSQVLRPELKAVCQLAQS